MASGSVTPGGVALQEGSAAYHLVFPALILWLATTWTGVDRFLAAVAVLVLIALVIIGRTGILTKVNPSSNIMLVAGALALIFDLLIQRMSFIDRSLALVIHVGGGMVLLVVWLCNKWEKAGLAVAAVLIFSALVGAYAIDQISEPKIDVWRAHAGAAELLLTGANPYADLDLLQDLSDPSSKRWQYFYPPVALAWYSGWSMVFGDPRWASLIAWLGALAIGGRTLIRLPKPAWGVTILAVTAVQPGWFLLLTGSFTEPLLMLLVVSFLVVQREHPTWGAVLLGLGLGAKQHLLLAIPAVFIGWSRYDRRSGTIAVLTAIGAFSIGVVFGPVQFLSATVVDPAVSAPINLQSVTLTGFLAAFGIMIAIPALVSIGLAVAAGLLAIRAPLLHKWQLRATTASVATFLALGDFAIWSNWTLVAFLLTTDGIASWAAANLPDPHVTMR
jgi:hypothetical protein